MSKQIQKNFWQLSLATNEGLFQALWYPDSYNTIHLLPLPRITALDLGRDALGLPGHIWEMSLTPLCNRSLQTYWGTWQSPAIFKAHLGHRGKNQIDVVPALMEVVTENKQHTTEQIWDYKLRNCYKDNK